MARNKGWLHNFSVLVVGHSRGCKRARSHDRPAHQSTHKGEPPGIRIGDGHTGGHHAGRGPGKSLLGYATAVDRKRNPASGAWARGGPRLWWGRPPLKPQSFIFSDCK